MIAQAPYHYMATDALEAWLRKQCARRRNEALGSAVILAGLSVLAHGFVYAVLLFLVFQQLGRILRLRDEAVAMLYLLAPVGVLLIAHVIYWIGRRRDFVRVSVPGGDVALDAEKESPVVLVPTHDDMDAQIDMRKLTVFPAWLLGYAVDQLAAALHLRNADTEAMAAVAMYLLQADRRVSFVDLGRDLGSVRLAGALRGLRHIHGVLLFAEDYPAVALNAELTQTLDRVARRGSDD